MHRRERRLLLEGACLAGALAVAFEVGLRTRARADDRLAPRGLAVAAPSSERWLAHLATDKPLYRPGETVRARAALLDAFTRAPISSGSVVLVRQRVRSPRGEVVSENTLAARAPVADLEWPIPSSSAGGEYKLAVDFPQEGLPESEIAFAVRSYRVPRLNTELEFALKAYGPGELVTATLKAARAEGGVPTGASATAVATLDGKEIHRSELALDASGRCTVAFSLPEKIGDGEGTLALVVRDGGVQETAARTIPVVVNRVLVEAFPEGGELVAGLEGRLYLEARTPRGKPASVAGRIVERASGRTLASFRSEHEGRARVAFTPRLPGKSCAIVLDEPSGCGEPIDLPAVVSSGFTLMTLEDAVFPGKPVRVRVASTESGKARLVLSQRERELSSVELDLDARKPEEAALSAPSAADGVLRVTLLDAHDLPRAERLVFRRPARSLQVLVQATPSRGALREPVTVKVRTFDESGRPAPATVTLSAVDDSVLETVERRERAPRLPAQALLASEVRELADSGAYLERGVDAAEKLDLLLGTQGWRRFAFFRPEKLVSDHGARGERVLARLRPVPPSALVAIGALRTINTQEVLFRDGDKEQDGNNDYGMLSELSNSTLIDSVLGSGVKQGYFFLAASSRARSGCRWFGTGNPALAGSTGDRYFEVDTSGIVYYCTIQPSRVFAHRALTTEGRTDFAETLYWNGALSTDERGEASFTFDLADSVTTFRIRADAFAASGALGAGDATVEARRAFYVEPKLPLEVTAGDLIEAPCALVNGTSGEVSARLDVETGELLEVAKSSCPKTLAADARRRALVSLAVRQGSGEAMVRLRASAGAAKDDVTRTVRVVPAGFPCEICSGGRLERRALQKIKLPARLEPGSLEGEAVLYPGPLSSLTRAVSALIREPCG